MRQDYISVLSCDCTIYGVRSKLLGIVDEPLVAIRKEIDPGNLEVVNPIMIYSHSFLFNCTTFCQAERDLKLSFRNIGF